jgi:hypothetical protein
MKSEWMDGNIVQKECIAKHKICHLVLQTRDREAMALCHCKAD